MKNNINVQFLCKDCKWYGSCKYYHNRKEDSYICKNFNLLEQRTGRWIPVGYDGYADGNPVYDWWECSECGWEHTGDEESLTAFCPNCGMKMEVEE